MEHITFDLNVKVWGQMRCFGHPTARVKMLSTFGSILVL